MSLADRSVTSASWNTFANLTRVVILFGRSVLLARWLPKEAFGVYATAGVIVGLSVVIPGFGLGGAFLHRAPETEDEGEAAAVHFTLRLILISLWVLLLVGGAFAFASGPTRAALIWLTLATGGLEMAQTPIMILTRRVVHRRLALIQLLTAVLTTIVALGLALNGATLWALLATDFVTMAVTLAALYLWRPVWRPRLAWSPAVVRYYFRFGSRTVAGVVLLQALNRLDDLWTRYFLGNVPLADYSRAYMFATYPRRVLAGPVNSVTVGTYAELKGDRKRLSQAFFRINALLVRSGFFLAGILALVAPEFIRIFLTAKWLTMLIAFRLMLVFTLLDPIKATVAHLFLAVGRPEMLVRARVVQLAVLVGGLFILGPPFGIAGVALAADAMLMVGMAILLWQARQHVDYSLRKLFGTPLLGLLAGLVLARLAITLPGVLGSDWRTGGVKIGVFVAVYGGLSLILEREHFLMLWKFLQQFRQKHRRAD